MENSRRIVFIDYLRGIAIISVFLYHCLMPAYGRYKLPWQWLHRSFMAPASFIALLPVHFGFLGVPMFFVISGFCIHLSFKEQGQEWASFFIRRFFRIYPAYIMALLVCLVFFAHGIHEFWVQFEYHALLIQNFNQGTRFAINGSFWSIAVEAQLYLVYPLLLWLVARFGWKRTLTALAACEIILDAWNDGIYQITAYSGYISPFLLLKVSPFLDHYIQSSPLGFWFSWSLGAYAAEALLKGEKLPLGKTSVVFLVFLVIASYFSILFAPFFFILCALLTTKIISKCLTPARVLQQAPNFWLRFLRRAGLYSYSIYLLHEPLMAGLGGLLCLAVPHDWRFLTFLLHVSTWVVVMPVAGLCYHFIERPGIGLGKRLIQNLSNRKRVSPESFSPTISADKNGEG